MTTFLKPTMLASLLISVSSVALADPLADARQSLKNYGLTRCLLQTLPEQSDIRADVAAASRAYHFMGSGQHGVLQDEHTLDVIHDPYRVVSNYMRQDHAEHAMVMKSGEVSVFGRCLNIYNSEAFDQLIRDQDEYVVE